MADVSEAKKRLPSQERLLLDYVQRLEKHRDGRSMVQVHLSALRPFNRREQHLRAAANIFDSIIKAMAGQLFVVKNGDMFFFFKNDVRGDVETAVQQVKYMFSDDPLVADEAEARTVFATWLDAIGEFEEIQRIIQVLADTEDRRMEEAKSRMDARAALRAKQKMGEPMTPEILAKIEGSLIRADLSNLLRRQFACSIDENMVPEPQFSELYISIQDLRETLMPGVNLLANRWLFNHMTETLDRRMLSMLSKTDRVGLSGDISFNINLRTLVSQDFLQFDDNVAASRRGAMIIELQKEDIFSDLGSYLFAREYIQAKGYRVSVDGLTYESMQIINHRRLGADMLKLVWNTELIDGGENVMAQVRKMTEDLGGDRVVLCRCDNREAIDFGIAAGIGLFQGRYVENLIAEDDRRRDLLKLKRRIERSTEPNEGDEEIGGGGEKEEKDDWLS
ncbi:MAG: hypothetical protein HQ501_06940 [Rhodospirillales bacterium]|nr:hypothetical protein [Rhodospirillales bacterium]